MKTSAQRECAHAMTSGAYSLRRPIAAENAGEFSWDYLEQGPEVWRVRIGKTAVAETADAS